MTHNILITGSEGYIGQRLITSLTKQFHIVGIDIQTKNHQSYPYYEIDIRDAAISDVIEHHNITHVVHLASVMQASENRNRDYDIDVNGTRNVIESCIKHNVKHVTVTSSGAAYGYHSDNPAWLKETHPLRGNDAFAYSQHKRLIEEMLADYRQTHPHLQQLILRPGTVLGAATNNQITNLFTQRWVLAIQGSPSPFVFIWDEDVVDIIIRGVTASKTGIYNLAGDGAMSINEIAQALNEPLLSLPAWFLRGVLAIGHRLGLTQYSAEQVDFLRYRPVLDNTALKRDFGYIPRKSTRQVFEYYLQHNHANKL